MDGKQDGGLPQGPLDFRLRHVHGGGGLGRFLLPEHQVHEQPDDDAENDRPNGTRRTDLRPQDAGGENDGQDVNGRPRVEKGNGRPQPGATLPDAGEKGQHRAGAYRQDGAGHAGHTIGDYLVGTGTQVFHHRSLGNEYRYGTGDKKSRDQTEQDMLLGIPLGQGQGLDHRMGKTSAVNGQKKKQQEAGDDQRQWFPDALPVDLAGFWLNIVRRNIQCFILTG